MKRSKKYRESEKLVDRNKVHSALEAAALAKKTTTVKFDASSFCSQTRQSIFNN